MIITCYINTGASLQSQVDVELVLTFIIVYTGTLDQWLGARTHPTGLIGLY